MSSSEVVTRKPVRLSYCFLVRPRKNDDGTPGKYSCTLLIPKKDTSTVKQMQDAIEAARAEGIASGLKNARSYLSPLKDGDGQKSHGGEYGPECKGHWVVSCSSRNQPKVVDKRLQPIIDDSEIYSGMWGNVDIVFKCFNVPGNSGITCYINMIQKIRDDEALGGTPRDPSSVFTAVDDDDEDDLGL